MWLRIRTRRRACAECGVLTHGIRPNEPVRGKAR